MQTSMRLSTFIRAELETILKDWEAFAGTILHARHMGTAGRRDHARDMLLTIADDLDSQQTDSEQAAKSKGWGPEEDGESWAEVHGADRQNSGFSVMETVSEFRALRASVVSHWISSYPTVAGQQLEDITRFHEAIDQAVAESLEHFTEVREMETRLFGAILVASPDPIYVMDLAGRFIYANRATADLFGMQPDDIIGKSNADLGFSFAPDLQRSVEKVIAERSSYRGKFAHRFASGDGERFDYVLAPVLDEHQRTEAIICMYRDVTEQALAEEKVWHTAHHDFLTGLPNRRLFLDRLEQEFKHSRRNNLPLALLFLDLDGFKAVNDSLGHEAGDHLLCEVAGRLAGCVREDDTVARLGGDEFTVILAGAEQCRSVEHLAQTIIDHIAAPFEIPLAPQAVNISVSIGISFYPHDASSPIELMKAADQAMYVAKETGSNRMCFYNVAENEADSRTTSISS